jgi:hypothetical protein
MNKTMRAGFDTSVVVSGCQAPRHFHGYLLESADLEVEEPSVRDSNAYQRATERWENEGGATLAGQACDATHLRHVSTQTLLPRHPILGHQQ